MVEKKNLMKLAGTVAPIITVFNDDESINEEKTIKHARWLIDNGVQGLVVCGSTGESIPMTKDERKRLSEAIMKEFINDVPVCIATGCYRTADTIELTKNAKDLGADSVLIIPPYYMGITKIQVFEHFKAIAKSVDIPILLYNNPSASGILISVQEIKNYWDLGIINGVKLTTVTLFSFTLSWGEMIYALVMVPSTMNKTLPVGIRSELIRGDVFFYGPLMAAALLSVIPVILIFSFFTDLYISGLTKSAVKY